MKTFRKKGIKYMNFQILCIGKIKDDFYQRQINGLCTWLKTKQHQIKIMEFPDERIPEKLSDKKKEDFLERECAKLMQKITSKDYLIALCIEGKEITTKQHREYMERALDEGYETITYVIGGSLGLPEQIKRRANLKMSFSRMTFPHQLMRMVLCEEIVQVLQ